MTLGIHAAVSLEEIVVMARKCDDYLLKLFEKKDNFKKLFEYSHPVPVFMV